MRVGDFDMVLNSFCVNSRNGFEWSETRGLEVTAIGSGFDNNGIEKIYHGDTNGFVYEHDTGNDFDGSSILARYTTPDYDYGDLGTSGALLVVNWLSSTLSLLFLLLTIFIVIIITCTKL